jgi:predicted GIY-YIG superfamily endonuclease
MTVYLLHFNQPLAHGVSPLGNAMQTQHYIGFTNDLVGRIMDHAEGRGARLMQVIAERGIDFKLARVWDGQDRKFERKVKNYKKARMLCPVCSSDKALERGPQ